MSIQSGDLRANVERVGMIETVQRIERDQNVQEFKHKERDAKRNRRNPHHAAASEEEPHDVVDVSSAYHTPDTDIGKRPADPTVKSPPAHPTHSDHHIDIKV